MIRIDGTDRNIFIPYIGATKDVDLGTFDLKTAGSARIGPTTELNLPAPLIVFSGEINDAADLIRFPKIFAGGVTFQLRAKGFAFDKTTWDIEGGMYDGTLASGAVQRLNLQANDTFLFYNPDSTYGIDVTIGEVGDGSNLIVNGAIEIVSTGDPQFRITNTTTIDFADFFVNTDGDLTITASGGDISLSDENLTTTGIGTFGSGSMVKENISGETEFIIWNSRAADSASASLVFRTTSSATDFGKILIDRIDSTNSEMEFYNRQGGVLTNVLIIDQSGDFDFLAGNLTTTGLIKCDGLAIRYATPTSGEFWMVSSDDNGLRIRVDVPSLYGFSTEFSNDISFTNEQGTTNQVFYLGDTSPTNSGTLFGIGASTSVANPSTGSEAGWATGVRFDLKGNGNLNLFGTVDISTTTNPQLRLTHTNGVDFAEFFTNSDGDLAITNSGGTITINGEVKLGDGTNFSKFETDGTLEFNGDATVWKDINIGAAQLSRPAASQPSEENFLTEAGADTGITTLAYAVGEKASGSFEMQHDYKTGSDFNFHVHWQGIADPSGAKNVQWRLTYVLMRDGTTLDAVTIIDSVDTEIDTQYKSYRSDFAVIDGSTKGNDGTAVRIEDQLLFTIERVASTGTAYAGDALVATMGIHYEVDTVGSRTITTK